MDQQPGRHADEYRAMPTAQSRRHADHEHGGKGMRDGPLIRVSEPEVERYVIQIDGNGSDKTCDIETTRRVDEAGQSEQTQRSGDQVGDFVERAAGQDAERNPAVGRVEGQRDPRQQYRNRPQPDQIPATQFHPTMLCSLLTTPPACPCGTAAGLSQGQHEAQVDPAGQVLDLLGDPAVMGLVSSAAMVRHGDLMASL